MLMAIMSVNVSRTKNAVFMPSGGKDSEQYNKVAKVAQLYHRVQKTKIFVCVASLESKANFHLSLRCLRSS